MDTTPLPSFATLLRKHRNTLHLSQEALYARSKVALRTISDLERGKGPQPARKTVKKLADALELEADARREFEQAAQAVGAGVKDSEFVTLETKRLPPVDEKAKLAGPPSAPMGPAPQLRQRWSVRTSSQLRRCGACVVSLLVLLAIWVFHDPLIAVLPITLRGDSLEVVGPLDLRSPQLVEGFRVVPSGQPVTAKFAIVNIGPKAVLLQTVSVGVRGPDACVRGWGANNYDFPQAAGPLLLPPGGEYQYEQTQSFTAPGVYFAEPVKRDGLGGWGGLAPSPRIWFVVVEAQTGRTPAVACTTPLPTRVPASLIAPSVSR